MRFIEQNWPPYLLLLILLAGFHVGNLLIRAIAYPLPAEIYQAGFFTRTAVLYVPFSLAVLAPIAMLAPVYESLKWSNLKHGRYIRLVIIAAGFALLWDLVSVEYNYYFLQAFHLERLALVVLLLLTWKHPIFAGPLTVLVYAFQGQIAHPFPPSDTNDKLPRQLLILFSSFLFLKLRYATPFPTLLDKLHLRRLLEDETPDTHVFVWGAATLIGASYFIPGWKKLEIYWPTREIVGLHLPFTYVRGWLSFLDPQTIQTAFEYLAVANPLLIVGTLAVELGAILLLWRKRLLYSMAAFMLIFHVLIFAVSGILFKKWMIVVVTFTLCVTWIDRSVDGTIFEKRAAIIITIIVLVAPMISLLFPATHLAWYSSSYDRTYTIEAGTTNGEVHEISWSEMGPYKLTFKQNRFASVDPNKTLTNQGARSSQDWSDIQRMRGITDPEEIIELREEEGEVLYTERDAEAFDTMLIRYLQAQECSRDASPWSQIPSLDHQFWGQPKSDIPNDADFEWVRIRRTGHLFTDGHIQTVDTEIVRTIEVPETDC